MELKRSLFYNYLRLGSQLLFPLITFPYISRVLGAENYGMVNFAQSVIQYGVLFSELGLMSYGSREISKLSSDPQAKFRLSSELFSLNLILSCLNTAIFAALILLVPAFQSYQLLLLLFLPLILANALAMEWYVQGSNQFRFSALRQMTIQAVSVVGLFALVHRAQDVWVYALLIVGGTLANALWNLAVYVRANARFPAFSAKAGRHLRLYLFFSITSIVTNLYINMDTVLLGLLSNATQVGFYTVGSKIPKMLLGLVTAGTSVFLVANSRLLDVADAEPLQRNFQLSLHSALLIALPLSVGLFCTRSELVLLFAAAGYEPSVDVLALSAWLVVIIGVTMVLAVQYLYPLGKEKWHLVAVSVGAVVGLVLNFLLIPPLGALGAAWATLAAELAGVCVLMVVTRKALESFAKSSNLLGVILGVIGVGLVCSALDLWAALPWPWLLLAKIGSSGLVFLLSLALGKDALLHQVGGKKKTTHA